MSEAKWQEVYKVQTAAITELEAERDRLRKALQKIIKEPYPVPKNDIAKQALEEIDND